jgi:hypothetical protein
MKYSKYNLLVSSDENNKHFIFNIFNGNCLNVNSTTANQVRENFFCDIDEKTKEIFVKTGVLLEDDVDERKIFGYMNMREKFNTRNIYCCRKGVLTHH